MVAGRLIALDAEEAAAAQAAPAAASAPGSNHQCDYVNVRVILGFSRPFRKPDGTQTLPNENVFLRREGQMIPLGTFSQLEERTRRKSLSNNRYGEVLGPTGTNYGTIFDDNIGDNLFIEAVEYLPVNVRMIFGFNTVFVKPDGSSISYDDDIFLRNNGQLIHLGTFDEVVNRSISISGYGNAGVFGIDGRNYGDLANPDMEQNFFIKTLPIGNESACGISGGKRRKNLTRKVRSKKVRTKKVRSRKHRSKKVRSR